MKIPEGSSCYYMTMTTIQGGYLGNRMKSPDITDRKPHVRRRLFSLKYFDSFD